MQAQALLGANGSKGAYFQESVHVMSSILILALPSLSVIALDGKFSGIF